MAKKVLAGVLLVMVYSLTGCNEIDSGKSTRITRTEKKMPTVKPIEVSEADAVEKMIADRQAYRNSLKVLVDYYARVGDNMKIEWAKDELSRLNGIPQYKYIVQAMVAPATLKATDNINEANLMYAEAYRIEKKAGQLIIIRHNDNYRLALQKYDDVIKKFPTSDKIDDCAFRSAGIHENYRDYSVAIMYYKRAVDWDHNTPHPALYKAAYLLDTYFERNDEALDLYRKALQRGKMNTIQTQYAKERIADITAGNSGSLK